MASAGSSQGNRPAHRSIQRRRAYQDNSLNAEAIRKKILCSDHYTSIHDSHTSCLADCGMQEIRQWRRRLVGLELRRNCLSHQRRFIARCSTRQSDSERSRQNDTENKVDCQEPGFSQQSLNLMTPQKLKSTPERPRKPAPRRTEISEA